jgi:hypothetical protein
MVHRMTTSSRQNLVSVGLGVVAGLLVVNAYGLLARAPATPAGGMVPTTEESALSGAIPGTASGAGRAGTDPRLGKLEDRIKELEAQGRHPGGKPDTRPREANPAVYQRELKAWGGRLAEHDAEPVDAKWAAPMTALLDTDFKDLSSEGGFAFGKPDCRSKSCTVEVEWPSFQEADEHYADLLHHAYSAGCSTRISLPNPAEPAPGAPAATSYSTRLILENCTGHGPTVQLAADNH